MSHGGGSDERWLVSYADFITLLMVLFVILYAGSQVDVTKYKQLASSLSAAFGGGPVKVVDPLINDSGGGADNQVPRPITIPGIPTSPLNTSDVTSQLTDMLSSSQLSNEISVQNNIEGMLISLGSKLLFVQDTADLQPEAYPLLDKLVEMVKPLPNEIRVIGNTNSTLPQNTRYKDNWDLSMQRALTIVRYLMSKGIEPKRLLPTGASDTRPLFPDDSPEHRALNSRADIVIIYQVTSNIIDLNFVDTKANTTGGGG
jgi:chemotaxis protein MotB